MSAMDTITAAGLALGATADLLLADPRRGHPVAGFGAVAARLERRAWRHSRAAGVGVRAGPGHRRDRCGGGPAPGDAAAPGSAAVLVTAADHLGRARRHVASAGPRADGRGSCGAGDLAGARAALPHLCGRDPQPARRPAWPAPSWSRSPRTPRTPWWRRCSGEPSPGTRTGGLPRGQHPRRDGGVPFGPVPAVRLGRGADGRRRPTGAGPGHRRADRGLRPAGDQD